MWWVPVKGLPGLPSWHLLSPPCFPSGEFSEGSGDVLGVGVPPLRHPEATGHQHGSSSSCFLPSAWVWQRLPWVFPVGTPGPKPTGAPSS